MAIYVPIYVTVYVTLKIELAKKEINCKNLILEGNRISFREKFN